MYLHFKSILAAHVLLLEIITGMEFKSKCNIGLSLAEGQILVNCKSKKNICCGQIKVDLMLILAFLEFLK